MPTYKVTDPSSGKSISLTGDSPPTESELTDIFSKVHGTPKDNSGYQDTQDPASPRNAPGVFPAQMEHDAWTKAIAEHPNDYSAAKNQVLAARNSYTQSRPADSLSQNIQGASGIVAATAMAPLGMAQDAVKSAGASVQKNYPGMAGSLIGGALKVAGGAIPASPKQLAGNISADIGIPAALSASNAPAKKVVGWFAQKFGGIGSDTLELLEDRAPEVVAYARQGYEAATKAASNAGKEIQSHIEQYANKAGEDYRKGVEAIISKNPQYNNLRIDLERNIGQELDKIRSDFGFVTPKERLPNLQLVDASGKAVEAAQGGVRRIGKAESDTALFNDFAGEVKNARTPTQVYYLQRDLSDAIKSNKGKPVAAALSQLKTQVVNAYDATVENTPLKSLNKGYRVAMNLGEELSRIGNADNPLQVIKSAFGRDTNTADSMTEFFSKSPQAKAAWEKAQVADAGAKISAWSRSLPNNGLALAPGLALGGVVHMAGASTPAALAIAAAEFAGTSPRLYGEAFNALSKGIPSSVVRPGSQFANASIQALLNQRKKDQDNGN